MNQLKDIVARCYSKSEVIRELGWKDSGYARRKLDAEISIHALDISHFQLNASKKIYERISKVCPVCGDMFTTRKHPTKEGITCSKACAATWFRTGTDNPNWKGKSYRTQAFRVYGKKCIVCDETRILDVHHRDGNHNNNNPENTIPVCPTHHRYLHSKYKAEIEDKINAVLSTMVIEA
jgi:hypothetical protein